MSKEPTIRVPEAALTCESARTAKECRTGKSAAVKSMFPSWKCKWGKPNKKSEVGKFFESIRRERCYLVR